MVVPPRPWHVIEYVSVDEGDTVSCPDELGDTLPTPWLMVQEDALLLVHARTDDPPTVTDVGEAVNDTVGAGGGFTVTVADALADPVLFVQVTV